MEWVKILFIIFENFPGWTGATSICLLDLLNVATGLQMKNSGNVLLFMMMVWWYDWYSAPYAAENNYCYRVWSLTISIKPVIFTAIIIRRKWHKVRRKRSKSEKKIARQRVVTYQYTYIHTSTPTGSSTAAKNIKVMSIYTAILIGFSNSWVNYARNLPNFLHKNVV